MRPGRRGRRGTAPGAPSPSAVLEAWGPLDRALAAYRAGRADAILTVHTDVGETEEQAVSVFFRTLEQMPPVEWAALDTARGRVLDLGAGVGVHALVLAGRGLEVTAAEPLPTAVEIMKAHGLTDVRRGGLDALAADERFDTVTLLMNGAGLAGSLTGVPGLLDGLRGCLSPNGQVLMDSTDPRGWEACEDGRYRGEIHYQLEFEGVRGPPFPFLFVDPDVLSAIAHEEGWKVDVLFEEEGGRYLARLTR